MLRAGLVIASGLLLLTAAVFAFAPHLDIAAARLFLGSSGEFLGVTPLGEMLRKLGYIVPFGLFAGVVLLWLARRTGFRSRPRPAGRDVVFLALTLALGPGLLVNTVLKDNSHRPRPVQTIELGGSHQFRPWYRFDGACVRNCSFVSGEASTGFWTLAPALLTPPPVRIAAVSASLVFGTFVALLRMSFGGHYLSDSLFSALLTVLLVLIAYRLMYRLSAPTGATRLSPKDPDLRGDPAAL